MKKWKQIVTVILSAAVFISAFAAVQRLVVPKYASEIPEGNFTAEYYKETTAHDVIIIGDCEVYENIDPIYMWKEYGITSYIRGNAQQLAWQSYYMLEDTLKYEMPKVVIYNVQALVHASPQKEEYNRMTLDGMRFSKTKFDAIKASMCDGENMLDYVFPLLRYHQRILDLSKEDIKYFSDRPKVSHNGYYMRIDVLPASESDVADGKWLFGDEWQGGGEDEEMSDYGDIDDPWDDLSEAGGDEEMSEDDDIDDPWDDMAVGEGNQSESEGDGQVSSNDSTDKGGEFGELPMKYLDKIRKLCEEKKITLILMKAPSLAPEWYDSYNKQIVDYAAKYKLEYINFYELLDETGVDFETDTYDGGLHLNLNGADKVSKYLGRVLQVNFGMKDHRSEDEYSSVYAQKVKFYENMIKAQQWELDEYGEIISY